jgi:hypothetical protein
MKNAASLSASEYIGRAHLFCRTAAVLPRGVAGHLVKPSLNGSPNRVQA